MRRYLLIYQLRNTTEREIWQIPARRACDARDEGRNAMNAKGLDAIKWPLISQSLVGETT